MILKKCIIAQQCGGIQIYYIWMWIQKFDQFGLGSFNDTSRFTLLQYQFIEGKKCQQFLNKIYSLEIYFFLDGF